VLGPTLTWRVFDEFDHMMNESLEGQAMELGWVRDNRGDLTRNDYLRMVLKKTCWYSFIHPCRIGALIATQDQVDLDRFNRFGFYLGAAFQIQDDLLNLTGSLNRYGKEIAGDLFEGKRTLMLIHLLERVDRQDARRLKMFLGQTRSTRSAADVAWVLGLMQSRGSMEYGRTVARQLAGATLYEFTQAFGGLPDSEEKEFLHQIIRYMVNRDL
ncbi:MAG: polyprenyl synthetase family protein, partial [Vicinamibacterales bacterium]